MSSTQNLRQSLLDPKKQVSESLPMRHSGTDFPVPRYDSPF